MIFLKLEMVLDFSEYSIFLHDSRCKTYLHILEILKILVGHAEISTGPVEYSTNFGGMVFQNVEKIHS